MCCIASQYVALCKHLQNFTLMNNKVCYIFLSPCWWRIIWKLSQAIQVPSVLWILPRLREELQTLICQKPGGGKSLTLIISFTSLAFSCPSKNVSPTQYITKHSGSKLFCKTTKFKNPQTRITPIFIKVNKYNRKMNELPTVGRGGILSKHPKQRFLCSWQVVPHSERAGSEV